MTNPEISVIIPFLNEEDNLPDLIAALEAFAPTMDVPIEVVFVDDGSTDGSVTVLRSTQFRNFTAQVVKLSRNFGSHAAVRAGFAAAEAPNCVWLGADLQEPLEIIRLGYEKIQAGFDLVCVQKNSVQVSASEETFSRMYSNLIQRYAIPGYPEKGVNTIFFNRKVKEQLLQNPEANSSVVLQCISMGYRQAVINVDYVERKRGVSKWSFGKKLKLMIDSFVAFSYFPIRMVSVLGFLFALIGGLIALYIIVVKVTGFAEVTLGWTSLLSILMIGFGLTNISLGIIAEYLWRTLDASRRRPPYIVDFVEELKSGG